MRLDKYLKVSRLIKRRTVANEACDAGKVIVNGKPARASYDVKVGDVLFTVVNVARLLDIDSERAMELACEKFINRFGMVEELAAERGVDMKEASLSQLDSLWEEVKIMQKKQTNGGNKT